MCFEQFEFICRFSSLGTLTCLWKPGVYSLPLHAPHNLCRKANPHFSSRRELSESRIHWFHSTAEGIAEPWLVSCGVSEERCWHQKCDGLSYAASKGKELCQPSSSLSAKLYLPITQHESWKAGILLSLYATSDTSLFHRKHFEQDHFGKDIPTWAFVDVFWAIPCHLIVFSNVELWFAAGSRSPKLVQHSGVLQVGNSHWWSTVKEFTASFV